jgi:hypothetical protein
MPLFKQVANTISTYLWPRKQNAVAPAKPTARRSPFWSLSTNIERDSVDAQPKNLRKRRAPSQSAENTTKRARFSLESDLDDLEGSTLLTTDAASTKSRGDRQLMPPPSLTKGSRSSKITSTSQVRYPELPDLDEEDEENNLFLGEKSTSSNRPGSSPIDLDSMSSDLKARYQAATALPENSGIWAEAERDLFFRLALRGFEPLLPPNWMLDFPTYPLTLYSNENSPPPLLQSLCDNDFRATRALKDLNEMGKRVRDRAISSLAPEPVIYSAVSAYIDWSLTDARMHPSQRPAALPVYVITSLQRNQTTHDALASMTAQLHDLAALHRARRGIRESVERDRTPASDVSATHVLDSDAEDLPILTGMLICSSLVNVMTMNAHAVPADFSSADRMAGAKPNERDETGLRFIATFDFSESGMDVWNALAVAIVGMHIRKMMLKQYELAVENGEEADWELQEVQNEEDDPDA